MKTSKCGSKGKRVKIRLQVETVLQADSRRVESWQNAKILVREYLDASRTFLDASRNRRSEISAALKCLFCPSFSTHYKSIIFSSNPKLGCGFWTKESKKGKLSSSQRAQKGKINWRREIEEKSLEASFGRISSSLFYFKALLYIC